MQAERAPVLAAGRAGRLVSAPRVEHRAGLPKIGGTHTLVAFVDANANGRRDRGEAGVAVREAMLGLGVVMPVLQLGLPDVLIDQGDPGQLFRLRGLDAAGEEGPVRERCADLSAGEGVPRLVASR